MDPLDRMIREYLAASRSGVGQERFLPGARDFYRFLTDDLKGEELERMLAHLKAHPDDQAFVMAARETLEAEPGPLSSPPRTLSAKVKGLLRARQELVCPHCSRPISPFKKPLQKQLISNAFFLAGAAVSFGLSFVFARYFIQFLAFGALLGIKWIVDQKSTKTQIMIYKALRQEEASPGRGDVLKHI